ncbi:MAG: RtcB family protein [Chloroflexi bacterium]|nr:RtcB family protein [Chloroflexota bacterium]
MPKWSSILRKIDDYRWELPQDYKPGMRVPGLVYADEALLRHLEEEQSLEQVANVAFLPGIVGRSLAMPDIHWGYGFPVGGVAATRADDGVISPGGIGFDINCGTRLLTTTFQKEDVRPRIEELTNHLFKNIPSGVGSAGKLRLKEKEIDQVLVQGARWAVSLGYGVPQDLEVTEEEGSLRGGDPEAVSRRAKERGRDQLGTLGSGNHFLEVQVVDEIYDPAIAAVMGVQELGQVMVFLHTGSRGLGHQVCTDHLKTMEAAATKYGISLPDRQLACAPVKSPEGREYLAAMAGGANFAWANRQCITHWVRESFEAVFGRPWQDLGLHVVYDVAHNIAKMEEYPLNGRPTTLCIHRKGATRAFPPGHPEVPEKYRAVGQPVLIPGDMGRYSYLLVGTEKAMEETWGSTCHGAGRVQSRTAAKRSLKGVDLVRELADKGITVKVVNRALLAEEASEAYKDVRDVVEVVHQAGISRRVARMRPLGVVKG